MENVVKSCWKMKNIFNVSRSPFCFIIWDSIYFDDCFSIFVCKENQIATKLDVLQEFFA